MITKPSRRDFLRTTAIAAGATLAAPYVKTAHAAGRVSVALWDHWVPGANETMRQVIEEWGAANSVEVVVDFLEAGTAENPLAQTIAAEARDRSGHDLVWLWDFEATRHKDALEPVDDLVEGLIAEYGPFAENASYLGRHDGTWRAVAAPCGSHSYPMVSRLDLWQKHAGIDLRSMFPAGQRDPAAAEPGPTRHSWRAARNCTRRATRSATRSAPGRIPRCGSRRSSWRSTRS